MSIFNFIHTRIIFILVSLVIFCILFIWGYRRKLKLRIAKVNTNICEQVYSWVRNFAFILNEMRPNRHKFALLSLARRRNKSIVKGEVTYLRSTRKPVSLKIQPYGCGKKNVQGKFMMKMMKSTKSKKWTGERECWAFALASIQNNISNQQVFHWHVLTICFYTRFIMSRNCLIYTGIAKPFHGCNVTRDAKLGPCARDHSLGVTSMSWFHFFKILFLCVFVCLANASCEC